MAETKTERVIKDWTAHSRLLWRESVMMEEVN